MTDQRDVLIHQECSSNATSEGRETCTQGLHRRLKQRFRPCLEFWSDGTDSDNPSAVPYSRQYDVRYFLRKGVPLGFAAFMHFGIPPLVVMGFAGHTGHSANLQASLGFARVWYYCTLLMPMFGLCNYYRTVIPGCIGAERKERIPRYFQRSILLILMFMVPFFMLQVFTDSILHTLGVPLDTASSVGHYCRLMIITSVLQILNLHLECSFNNLGYVKSTTFNSFFCGLLVDCSSTYVFIYVLRWGMTGAALARIVVYSCTLASWCIMMCYHKLTGVICIACDASEPLLTMKEIRVFLGLTIPAMFFFFAGWLVFELQLITVANISGISQNALAAGAIWVQLEQGVAAFQNGWVEATSMRTLALLGRQDPGARDGFYLLHKLSALSVAFGNALILLFAGPLCRFMTNDVFVQQWLSKILWILVLHAQTRLSYNLPVFLYLPLGKGALQIGVSIISFYVIAVPIGGLVALTDIVTHSLTIKLWFCLGITTIAQTVGAIFNFVYLSKLDWHAAGMIINGRANADKQESVTPPQSEVEPADDAVI